MSAPPPPVASRPDGSANRPLRIVSGGQTGVDRGALDAALEGGVTVGGWCPTGRAAEDGPIPERYPLRETASSDPAERTRLNVRDSDAALIIAPAAPAGGTALALAAARELRRPLLLVDPREPDAAARVAEWLLANNVAVLSVGGPRASEWDGAYAGAYGLVRDVLRLLAPRAPAART